MSDLREQVSRLLEKKQVVRAWDKAAAHARAREGVLCATARRILRDLVHRMPPAAWSEARAETARVVGREPPPVGSLMGVCEFPTILEQDDQSDFVRVTVRRVDGDKDAWFPDGLEASVAGSIEDALVAARRLTGSTSSFEVLLDEPVTGGSCGLAVALAAVSCIDGCGIPAASLVATGRVQPDGKVTSVEHLPRKVDLRADLRPRARLLVPAGMALGEDRFVMPVASLGAARDELWDDAETQEDALRAYRDGLKRELEFVPRRGLAGGWTNRESPDLPFEQVYVPLLVRLRGDTDKQDRRRGLEEIIEEHSALVLLGPPGGGKTTSLRAVSRSALGRGWTPVHLSLAAFGQALRDDQGLSLQDYLRRQAKSRGETLKKPGLVRAFDKVREQGRLFYVLDGLDEVEGRDIRDRVRYALDQFCGERGGNRILVTSRPEGYDEGLGAGWRVAELVPMDDAQIGTYVARDRAARPGGQVAAEANEFLARIRRKDSVWALARNPLLLSLLLRLFDEDGHLPAHRAPVLYSALVTLLDSWRRRRDASRGARQPAPWRTPEEALKLWGRVAFDSSEAGERGRMPLKATVRRVVACARVERDRAIEFIDYALDCGLLVRGAGRTLELRHLAFYELLVAWHVVQEGTTVDFVATHTGSAEQRQVVLLIAGLLLHEEQDLAGAQAVLHAVLDADDPLLHEGLERGLDLIADRAVDPGDALDDELFLRCVRAATLRPFGRFRELAYRAIHLRSRPLGEPEVRALVELAQAVGLDSSSSLLSDALKWLARSVPLPEALELARGHLEADRPAERFYAAVLLAGSGRRDEEVLGGLCQFWSVRGDGVQLVRSLLTLPPLLEATRARAAAEASLGWSLLLLLAPDTNYDAFVQGLLRETESTPEVREALEVVAFLARDDEGMARALVHAVQVSDSHRAAELLGRAVQDGRAVVDVLASRLAGGDAEERARAAEIASKLSRYGPRAIAAWEEHWRTTRPAPYIAALLIRQEGLAALRSEFVAELVVALDDDNVDLVARAADAIWSTTVRRVGEARPPVPALSELVSAWARLLIEQPSRREWARQLAHVAAGPSDVPEALSRKAVVALKEGLRRGTPRTRLDCASELRPLSMRPNEIVQAIEPLLDGVERTRASHFILELVPEHEGAANVLADSAFDPETGELEDRTSRVLVRLREIEWVDVGFLRRLLGAPFNQGLDYHVQQHVAWCARRDEESLQVVLQAFKGEEGPSVDRAQDVLLELTRQIEVAEPRAGLLDALCAFMDPAETDVAWRTAQMLRFMGEADCDEVARVHLESSNPERSLEAATWLLHSDVPTHASSATASLVRLACEAEFETRFKALERLRPWPIDAARPWTDGLVGILDAADAETRLRGALCWFGWGGPPERLVSVLVPMLCDEDELARPELLRRAVPFDAPPILVGWAGQTVGQAAFSILVAIEPEAAERALFEVYDGADENRLLDVGLSLLFQVGRRSERLVEIDLQLARANSCSARDRLLRANASDPRLTRVALGLMAGHQRGWAESLLVQIVRAAAIDLQEAAEALADLAPEPRLRVLKILDREGVDTSLTAPLRVAAAIEQDQRLDVLEIPEPARRAVIECLLNWPFRSLEERAQAAWLLTGLPEHFGFVVSTLERAMSSDDAWERYRSAGWLLAEAPVLREEALATLEALLADEHVGDEAAVLLLGAGVSAPELWKRLEQSGQTLHLPKLARMWPREVAELGARIVERGPDLDVYTLGLYIEFARAAGWSCKAQARLLACSRFEDTGHGVGSYQIIDIVLSIAGVEVQESWLDETRSRTWSPDGFIEALCVRGGLPEAVLDVVLEIIDEADSARELESLVPLVDALADDGLAQRVARVWLFHLLGRRRSSP
ncbi:MAG: NACHT domain-containing protein [Polyangiaceae bacterium]|nr:NACHT domain-containing protein [Polyangiaceae bacterium]